MCVFDATIPFVLSLSMAAIASTSWRGLPAWQVTGSDLAFLVTARGGHLVCLREATGSDINPLWEPDWPTSGDVASAEAAGTWGSGPEAALLCGIAGSNLCLDRFGGAGAAYAGAAARPLHGEVGVTEFSQCGAAAGGAADLVVAADLPAAALRVTRAFTLRGRSLLLSTTAERLGGGGDAQYVEWCEHTTLGGQFLDGVEITAAVDAVMAMPADGADAAPAATDAPALAAALAFPSADAPPASAIASCRLADGAWRAANARLGFALSARFSAADFPFLCLWTEHQSRTHAPWAGRQRARGMEMTTKPFPEGEPPPSRARELLGKPAAMFLPPTGAVTKTIEFTWARL